MLQKLRKKNDTSSFEGAINQISGMGLAEGRRDFRCRFYIVHPHNSKFVARLLLMILEICVGTISAMRFPAE